MQSIFDSLVQPHFNYCSVAWDCCDKTLVIRLQKLQNRAATVLTFSGYDSDADYLIKRINWQNLDSQRKYHKKVMVYRSINGLAPKYLSKLFTNRDSVTSCSLRANCPFLSPAQKKKLIGYRNAVLWNSQWSYGKQIIHCSFKATRHGSNGKQAYTVYIFISSL